MGEHKQGAMTRREVVRGLALGIGMLTAGLPLRAMAADNVNLVIIGNDTMSPSNPVPDVAATYTDVWNAFKAANPGIDMTVQRLRGHQSDAFQEVLTSLANGGQFDIGIFDPQWLPRLQLGNYLEPLDDLLTAEEKADFLPGILDAGTVDGHLRMISIYNSYRGLFFRPSAVKAIGYEAPPTDLDEFIKFGEAAKGAGYQYALMLPGTRSNPTLLYFLQQYFGLGGELYDAEGKPAFFTSPNREHLIAVYDMWRDFVVRGFMPADVGAMTEADERSFFYSGQTITVGASTSHIQQMYLDVPDLKGDLSVVGMPMPSGHKPVPLISNWGYTILTKDPARAEAARAYIRHMVSTETLTKTNTAQGQLPVRQSVWKTAPAFSEGALMSALYNIQNDPALRTASGIHASYTDIGYAIAGQLSDVLAGNVSSADAVDKAGKDAMDAYQRLKDAM